MSGSKGIQIYIPLNSGVTYEETQAFAKQMAQTLEREHPDLVISEMAKKLRPGKIFVDWSQNSDFKTTVGVYSWAKTGRPYVSLPVTWDELDRCEGSRSGLFCLEPAAIQAAGKTGRHLRAGAHHEGTDAPQPIPLCDSKTRGQPAAL